MADMVLRLLIIFSKIAVYMVSIVALIVLLTIISSALMIGLNFGIINDLVALVQMWLPFNLGVIILWIVSVSVAYITYRLSLIAIAYLSALNT